MARVSKRDLGLIALGLSFLGWAIIPPDSVSLDPSCGPNGGPAALSAAVFHDAFWGKQLRAVVAERDDLLARPARRARLEEEERREASAIEGRMDRLNREQSRVDNRAEKERQEMAEQSARLKRVNWLMQCETVIRQKLAD